MSLVKPPTFGPPRNVIVEVEIGRTHTEILQKPETAEVRKTDTSPVYDRLRGTARREIPRAIIAISQGWYSATVTVPGVQQY